MFGAVPSLADAECAVGFAPLAAPRAGLAHALISRLSEEIPWPYNRPFPFHRLVLRRTQRSLPFGSGVVVVNTDGVGNLKVAVACAIEAGCIAGTSKLLCWDLQIGQTSAIGERF